MTTLWLDTETFSEISLKKAGSYRYAEDCETIIISWAWNDEPVEVRDWTLVNREYAKADLQRRINKADEIILHNSAFDRVTLARQGVVIPVEKITDTMVLALQHSLPAALDKLCDVLSVPQDKAKLKDGKRLINLFCKPRPKNVKLRRATRETHPDDWQAFLEYARLDVEAMREVLKRLPRWNDTPLEREYWYLDQQCNDRGFAVDLDLATSALRAFERTSAALAVQAIEMTGGAVGATTQRDKLLAHMSTAHGFETGDLRKGTVTALLKDKTLPDDVRELLENRQQAAATSPAKYRALLDAAGSDGRLRGTIQFCGAGRTSRDAGRIFQPQNLPRPSLPAERIEAAITAMKADCEDLLYDNVTEVCTNAVRGALVAPEGKKLVVSDLSNIEGRVAAWLAGENWKLQAFRDYDAGIGPDLYVASYARSFNVDPQVVLDDKKYGNGIMRQIGKVMELAFQFGGAVGAFATMSVIYGVDLPEGEVVGLVKAWRAAHPQIKSMWYDIDRAVRLAIENVGSTYVVRTLSFDCKRDAYGQLWLRMKVPGGGFICYLNPEIDKHECARCDGEGEVDFEFEGVVKRLQCPECGGTGETGRGEVTYEGVNQYTRQWERLRTYGGKFFEQATQKTARDVFKAGLRRAARAGYDLVLPVHDEAVTEVPDTDNYNDRQLSQLLATPSQWMLGLPLAAAGGEMKRYRKGD